MTANIAKLPPLRWLLVLLLSLFGLTMGRAAAFEKYDSDCWSIAAKGGVTSFSEGPALGGALYSEAKLQQLVPYLNKRGVSVFETTGNARYVARADGTGTMYLPANPTTLQVKHELSHFLDHRRLGFERYSEVRSSARESWVRSRLMQNRSWDDFNPAEQDFTIRYPDKVLNEGR